MHPRMEIKYNSAPTLFSAILALLVSSLDENVVTIQVSWADKCIHSLLQRLFHWLYSRLPSTSFWQGWLRPLRWTTRWLVQFSERVLFCLEFEWWKVKPVVVLDTPFHHLFTSLKAFKVWERRLQVSVTGLSVFQFFSWYPKRWMCKFCFNVLLGKYPVHPISSCFTELDTAYKIQWISQTK